MKRKRDSSHQHGECNLNAKTLVYGCSDQPFIAARVERFFEAIGQAVLSGRPSHLPGCRSRSFPRSTLHRLRRVRSGDVSRLEDARGLDAQSWKEKL